MEIVKNPEKQLTLLILAAGIGSRYGSIKQMDAFGPNGETIMDYSVYDALRAGFTKVVFIVRDEMLEAVKEKFESLLKGKASVAFVIQSPEKLVPPQYQPAGRAKPWGTGHALLCAGELIHEPCAVINADDFYGGNAFVSIADFFFKDKTGTHAMVSYRLKNVLSEYGSVSRGVGATDQEGNLTSLTEKTNIVLENGKITSKEKDGDLQLDPGTPISMNFWGFYPDIFEFGTRMFNEFLKTNHQDAKAEFYIPFIVNEILRQRKGQVKVLNGGDTWFGITYKGDKEAVSGKIAELIKKGVYPEKLWN